jgi:hypothetical protein
MRARTIGKSRYRFDLPWPARERVAPRFQYALMSPIRTRDQMPRERCLIREPLHSVIVFSEPIFHL